MNKKGIEGTMLVLLLLAIIVIVASTAFFVRFKGKVFDCNPDDFKNIHFLGDLPDKISLMSGPSGYNSREPFSFKVPCGDRAFFVNLEKRQEILDSGTLDEEPIIKSEIESNTGKNFFVMSGSKMVSAYALSNLKLDYPYNLCFSTKSSRTVKVEIEGLGQKGVRIMPHCEQVECTTVPEIVLGGDLENLLNLICQGDSSCIDAERANINNAKDGVEVRLKINTCFPETTKVEFIISLKEGVQEANEVKLFETVDKGCINSLAGGVKVEGGDDEDVIVDPDPMLVWTFGTVKEKEEKRVSYEIPGILSDDCRQQLKAVVGAGRVKYTSKHPTKAGRTETSSSEHPDRLKAGRTALPKVRKEHKKEWVTINAATRQITKTDRDEVLTRLNIPRREGGGKQPTPTGGNAPPIQLKDIEDPDEFRIFNKQTDILINNLNQYFSGKDLQFVISTSDPAKITCDINSNLNVDCEPKIFDRDTLEVTVTVEAKNNAGSVKDSFKVKFEK